MDDAIIEVPLTSSHSDHQPVNLDNRDAEQPQSQRIRLGMSSFNEKERTQFGESMRIAMAFIQGKTDALPNPGKALPSDTNSIRKRLKVIGQSITQGHADQLELLVRFDELRGWATSGARSCPAWMNTELGISTSLAFDYLRAGRKLRNLPVIRALFRAGQLTWSKIRLLTRVATDENEVGLCHAALDASVSQLARLCDEYRWAQDSKNSDENARALKQWEERSLTWGATSNGNTRIVLSLPPEIAQAVLNSIEHSLSQMERTSDSMTQRRADAAVLMAENALQNAGCEIATADRYQVIVSVDASELEQSSEKPSVSDSDQKPVKKATLSGGGSLAHETARRMSCDCTVMAIINSDGEPTHIGQKARVWPAAMSRAIKQRDQRCIWPGCEQSRHLHIHHINHWADGGPTSIENGCCLCTGHHHLVHEGDYRIERVANDAIRLQEQFELQTANPDGPFIIDAERMLRNSPESFDYVRGLSPERFRFRVLDKQGNDIAGQLYAYARELSDPPAVANPLAQPTQASDSTHSEHLVEPDQPEQPEIPNPPTCPIHSTRVESAASPDDAIPWIVSVFGNVDNSNTRECSDSPSPDSAPGVKDLVGAYDVRRRPSRMLSPSRTMFTIPAVSSRACTA